MSLPRPTELAHMLLGNHLKPGDLAVDATAGNGHDTVFLARCVTGTGRIIAFDIQQAALDATGSRLADAGLLDRVTLILGSHGTLDDHVPPERAAAIVFNLGYLPGANHAVTTMTDVTLRALERATGRLMPGGLLTVVCYPGHEEGAKEAAQVEEWFNALVPKNWRITQFGNSVTRKPSPFLLAGVKPGKSGALG
jgi:tRNA A58 N-methylase Trm61